MVGWILFQESHYSLDPNCVSRDRSQQNLRLVAATAWTRVCMSNSMLIVHPVLQRQWQPQHRWISSKATSASEPQPITTWDKWMSQTYRNKHRFLKTLPPVFGQFMPSPPCAQTQIFSYHLPLKGLRFKLRWSFRDAQPWHLHHHSTPPHSLFAPTF